MKSYTERFESITTIKGLFDFRDELETDAKNNDDWSTGNVNTDKLNKCQEANWYKRIVEKRIEVLIRDGESLDKINPKKEEETKK